MSDFVLIDGDTVLFMPTFGAATVVPQPGKLQGSGPATQGSKKLCVDGDEKNVSVPGCMYMTPQYCIPGSGTLKIDSLGGDQKASKTKTGGVAVLLKGGNFTAKFEVQSPAQQPTPSGPIPDASPQYGGGSGQFITTNTKFKGS
ncbi:MAG: hypothetical protein KF778_03970 [Rhodocyclaceae bacterium]|nr:hypothetical protein [Rhodocyclaceae bacterium]MBX3667537.1 hypothetical protein [Rhodocyclaceae bacterium]